MARGLLLCFWRQMIMYIYPDNLKAAPTFWLWQLKDITIGGLLAVLGAVTFVYAGSYMAAAIAGAYLFLTIRFDDACILDFIKKALIFFIGKPQFYHWGSPYVTQEVSNHQKTYNEQRKKISRKKQIYPNSHERQGDHRKQHPDAKRR